MTTLSKIIELELGKFEEKFGQSFNIGVVPDDITREKIKSFLSFSIRSVIEEVVREIREGIIEKASFEPGVSSNGWYSLYQDDLDSIISSLLGGKE